MRILNCETKREVEYCVLNRDVRFYANEKKMLFARDRNVYIVDDDDNNMNLNVEFVVDSIEISHSFSMHGRAP